jgi:hypothetical protein
MPRARHSDPGQTASPRDSQRQCHKGGDRSTFSRRQCWWVGSCRRRSRPHAPRTRPVLRTRAPAARSTATSSCCLTDHVGSSLALASGRPELGRLVRSCASLETWHSRNSCFSCASEICIRKDQFAQWRQGDANILRPNVGYLIQGRRLTIDGSLRGVGEGQLLPPWRFFSVVKW